MPTGLGSPVRAGGRWDIVQSWIRFGEGAPGTVLGVGIGVARVGVVGGGGVWVFLGVVAAGAIAGY